MAHVIDRLRVRGVSATGFTSLPAYASKHSHVCENIPPSRSKTDVEKKGRQVWKTGDGTRHDISGLGFSSASRRMEHMQRVRAAYNGLSTMDSSVGPPSVQFILQGKNMKRDSTSSHRLMMSTGLTGNASDIVSAKSDSGVFVAPNMKVRKAKSEPPGEIHGKDKKREVSGTSILPSFPATCISLAPPSTPIYLNNYMASKSFLKESFEIMGHKVRGAGANDKPSVALASEPEQLTPRPSRKWTRTLFKEGSSAPMAVSAQSLNQCLHVQQSNRQLHNDLEHDAIKLKHFTQFVRNDGKINYINPYRQMKSRERKPLVRVTIPNKYNFSSVNSYVHFNKIYPQRPSNSSKMSHVPQMSGFPTHCTDTVMLRMMVEMNRPKFNKSQTMDKYSDIGMQQDLEEYLMVRSPSTVSKPPSTNSKKQGRGQSSKSLVSNQEAAVEEEVTCVWAGNNVQEDMDNADSPDPMDTN
ncbi:uncharacterized protein LOC121370828 [Gigantopelta aegis]|uniref:uncharacterized protein LOC121370828 n=1 Tax=Gigantopelta aegis TaxID=1735272 RepID=UPI001B88DF8B|nr:uncharacterized protein LOC121370828 [Gigantopelta aegis]XP_041352254.1 uncharacterized protein LOC121370828 [Gigantopelta aegis]